MVKRLPDIIKEAARNLRQNMTESEKILWSELKSKKLDNIKFDRQIPIYVFTENSGLDRYVIPDFIAKQDKIIIELDGNIHNLEEVYALDKVKEKLLQNMGYKIIRFKNDEIINNLSNILTQIAASFPRRGREFKREGLDSKI